MSMESKWLFASVILVMAGCAAQPYVAPTTGPTATIEFWGSSNSGSISAGVFTKPQCAGLRTVADGAAAFPGTPIPIASSKVPTGQPLTFLIAEIGTYSYCPAIQSFSPRVDGKYIAYYEAVDGGCRMRLLESVTDAAVLASLADTDKIPLGQQTLTPVKDVKVLNYVKPWGIDDPMCPGQ